MWPKIKTALVVVVLTLLIWVFAERAVIQKRFVNARVDLLTAQPDLLVRFLDKSGVAQSGTEQILKLNLSGPSGRIQELAALGEDVIKAPELDITKLGYQEGVRDYTVGVIEELLEGEVTGGYAGDLLSDVLANSEKGYVWITLQIHQNIIAVASSKELSGIIIVNGRKPKEETLMRANEEKIPVMISNSLTYEVAGKLYEIGIR